MKWSSKSTMSFMSTLADQCVGIGGAGKTSKTGKKRSKEPRQADALRPRERDTTPPNTDRCWNALETTVNRILALHLCVSLTFGCSSNLEVNGAQLEYEVLGSGKQTVLFEAGALSGMAGWDAIWGSLPDGITAIRYSRRGEGNSSGCTGQISYSQYADDLAALLVQLDVQGPVVYVSHSLGGPISQVYAAQNPGKVAAMLLVDPANPRDVEIITTVDEENGPAEVEQIKQQDYTVGADTYCFLDALWNKSPAPGFADIGDIPITLIAGVKKVSNPQRIFDSDDARRLWGSYQSEWANQFPRGKAVVTDRSGHFVQDDEPELVIQELRKLLDKVATNSSL